MSFGIIIEHLVVVGLLLANFHSRSGEIDISQSWAKAMKLVAKIEDEG